MAGAELGAFGAEAVVTRRGHQRNHRGAVVEAFDVGHVAAARGLRPGFDLGQCAQGKTIRKLGTHAGLRQTMPTEVTGTPLQQSQPQGNGQDLRQPRQVAQEELVLQALGGRADQRALARQQQGHQVRKSLADAGAGFGHQRRPLFDRALHRLGHQDLAGARQVTGIMSRQRTVVAEGLLDVPPVVAVSHAVAGRMQASGSASCGFRWIELDFQPGDLVAQQQTPLLQPAQGKLVNTHVDRVAIDEIVEIRVLHAKLDQAALRGMQVVVHCCTRGRPAWSLYSRS